MTLYRFRKSGQAGAKGQMIIEYVVMFTVIVAVILYASVKYIRPVVNNFFNATSRVLKNATDTIENVY